MKTIFTTILIAAASMTQLTLAAQEHRCDGSTQAADYLEFLDRAVNGSYDPDQLSIPMDPGNPIVVKLSFHSLDLGAFPGAFTYGDALQMMQIANSQFAGTGIQFEFLGLTNDATTLTNVFQVDQIWTILNLYETRDAIDVYLVNSSSFYTGIRGFGTYSLCSRGQGILLEKSSTPNGMAYGGSQNVIGTWIHELGHYFDLIHPGEEWEDPFGSGGLNYAADCPDFSNCTTAGDFICDTAAEPDPSAYPFPLYNNCVYSFANNPVVVTQPQSACPGMTYSPTVGNFMGLSPPECRFSFTQGQRGRMFAALINFRPELYDPCLGGSADLLECDTSVTVTPANGRAGASAAISNFTAESGVGSVVGAPASNRVHHFSGMSAINMSYEGTIHPNGGDSHGRFGHSVSFDGQTLIIGAPDAGTNNAGRVFVYERQGDGYQFVQSIDPPGATLDFGVSIDLYGEWLVVGGNDNEAPAGQLQVNLVSLYRHDEPSQSWVLHANLSPAFAGVTDPIHFGGSVAISGQHIVVGAHRGTNTTPGTTLTGSAYVYERNGAGWNSAVKLPVPTTVNSFGWDVDVWGDTIVVGAPDDHLGLQGVTGSVHFYQKVGTVFVPSPQVDNPDAANPSSAVDGRFGSELTLARNSAVIGDPSYFGNNLGIVHEFARRPFRQWDLVRSILPLEFQFDQSFGSSVASSGEIFMIGAEGKDRGSDANVGGVYAFGHQGLPASMFLNTDTTEISAGAGGTATMTIDFGEEAGGRVYGVAGSLSAPLPGQDVSMIKIPSFDSFEHLAFHTILSYDPYFAATTSPGGIPFLAPRIGVLDSKGRATITFDWPAGLLANSSQLPLTFTHTAVLLRDLHYESSAAAITLVP